MISTSLIAALCLVLPGQVKPVPSPPAPVDPRLAFEEVVKAPEIVTPTGLTVDHRGRVLVVESHTHFRPKGYPGPLADRIRIFEKLPGSGKLGPGRTFFEGTRFSMNLAEARDGSFFLATRAAIYRLEDRDGDGRADGEAARHVPDPIVRLETRGDYPHNGLSGFAFDLGGNVYFGLGENLGADYRLVGSDGSSRAGGGEGGNIYRCRPDGSKLETVATGFWNPFHVAFDTFGRLFAVDNDPDSRPPCRLLHIVEGGDYGYRFRNGRKGLHPFTAWNGELPGTLPMLAGTGEAPSGLVVYESDDLPEDYRGSILVTSWGDHRIERYRPQPRGASFRAVMEPVIVGGEDFRPVGIAPAPDGSLYISDWVDKSYELHGKGRVWRLGARTPGNKPAAPSPRENLGHPRRLVREQAAAQLEAGGPAGQAVLAEVARTGADARARALALEVLIRGGRLAGEPLKPNFLALQSGLGDGSADVRAVAIRLLSGEPVSLDKQAASDPSPLVKAEALRRISPPTVARETLLKALESDDPFLQQAARRGLNRSLGVPGLFALAGSTNPAQRLAAVLILRDSGRPEARKLFPGLLSDPDPLVRFAAIQWVGEQRLQEYRPQLVAGLASGSGSRQEFEGTLAALEMLSGTRRDPRMEVAGEDYVAALLKDPGTSSAVIRRGLRLIRPDHPALTIDLLRKFLESADEQVRLEVVRTLRGSTLAGRFDLLARVAEDAHQSLTLRAEAITGLADDAGRLKAPLLGLATSDEPILRHEAIRALRGVSLTEPERERLARSSRGDIEGLSLIEVIRAPETKSGAAPAPSPSRESSPANDVAAWLGRLAGPADAAAGERVFFHPKGPGCYRCHQVDGRGGRAGPELSRLAEGMTRERLVQSIVQPSREIAPQFVPYSVALDDGTVFTGLQLAESPDGTVTFADSQGKLITVKSGEIEELKPQSVSIMPEDLPRTMTVQEFRDVLAFLASRSR